VPEKERVFHRPGKNKQFYVEGCGPVQSWFLMPKTNQHNKFV